jgi:hypothetical protein
MEKNFIICDENNSALKEIPKSKFLWILRDDSVSERLSTDRLQRFHVKTGNKEYKLDGLNNELPVFRTNGIALGNMIVSKSLSNSQLWLVK